MPARLPDTSEARCLFGHSPRSSGPGAGPARGGSGRSARSGFRRPLLSNRDMMVRRGHHTTGPRGARDAPSGAARDRSRRWSLIARRPAPDRRPTGARSAGPVLVGCPNLLQRPRSRRGAKRESLIFRASSRGRSRPETPLQQIWTSRRSDQSHAPHAPHPVGGSGRCGRRSRAAPSRGTPGTVGNPAWFPIVALREDRSGRCAGCAWWFPHDSAVSVPARWGAGRNDPPGAPCPAPSSTPTTSSAGRTASDFTTASSPLSSTE